MTTTEPNTTDALLSFPDVNDDAVFQKIREEIAALPIGSVLVKCTEWQWRVEYIPVISTEKEDPT